MILDPELTATTPERIWLGTGIRAVDHCVETYLSSGVGSKDGVTEETDRLALHALGLLIPGLVKCRLNNKDGIDADGDGGKAARLDCALGSVDAMAACSAGLPLGASHGIGHQVSIPFSHSFIYHKDVYIYICTKLHAIGNDSSALSACPTAKQAVFSSPPYANTTPSTAAAATAMCFPDRLNSATSCSGRRVWRG